METIEQLDEKLNALLAKWEQGFMPLYFSVNSIKSVMFDRIFTDGLNTAGTQLPSPSYSTKEIYVDVNSARGIPSSFQVGKRGTKIKSAYFPEGYQQLKQAVGRPVLELTNSLKLAFANYPVIESGDSASIALPNSERGKRLGLEDKYGTIFQMTQEETDLFTEVLQYEIIQAINKALQ